MEFGAIGENVPLILVIVGVILLQFFLMKKRNPEVTYRETVQSLLSEVRLNQALVETFHLRQKPKKFEATSWRRTQNKLDFLNQPLQVSLSDAFIIVEDFNHQVEAAKKHGSTSYVANLRVDRLKELLAKSRQGLEQWIKKNTGLKEPPPKYPGLLDGLFGGR